MSESDTASYSVLIWVTEGTWQSCVAAALLLAPASAQFTLMYVVTADLLLDRALERPEERALGGMRHHGALPLADLPRMAAAALSASEHTGSFAAGV